LNFYCKFSRLHIKSQVESLCVKQATPHNWQELNILMSCRETPDRILRMDVDNFVMPAGSGEDQCAAPWASG
jgi:hypothetical protein